MVGSVSDSGKNKLIKTLMTCLKQELRDRLFSIKYKNVMGLIHSVYSMTQGTVFREPIKMYSKKWAHLTLL